MIDISIALVYKGNTFLTNRDPFTRKAGENNRHQCIPYTGNVFFPMCIRYVRIFSGITPTLTKTTILICATKRTVMIFGETFFTIAKNTSNVIEKLPTQLAFFVL